MPPRIAFDTNLLVAALTKPTGASGRILRAWRAGEIELVASDATIREAELVLGAGWLSRITSRPAVEQLLADLRSLAVQVGPMTRVTDLPLKDPGDLRMLEAALEGDAQYVVTTDREFLSHRGYQTIEFLTPTEFWSVFEADGDAL
jgi:putative PIN family toxin of toxin-antitoxin system